MTDLGTWANNVRSSARDLLLKESLGAVSGVTVRATTASSTVDCEPIIHPRGLLSEPSDHAIRARRARSALGRPENL